MKSSRHPLQLYLLASGATQHVFERQPDDGWVYKTPAIMDELLPSRPAMGRLHPAGSAGRLFQSLFYRIPRDAWRRFTRDTTRTGVDKAGRGLAQAYLAVANVTVGWYLRRSRVKAFHRSLALHRKIHDDPETRWGILPTRPLPRSRATLHTATGAWLYCGPMLMQRRAEHFFEGCEGLDRLDPDRLIEIQQSLWRRGIGLADLAGALGPYGWALHEGELYLADTGSLTTRLGVALAIFDVKTLERFVDRQLRRQLDDCTWERTAEYYRIVRRQITPARLAELWRQYPAV